MVAKEGATEEAGQSASQNEVQVVKQFWNLTIFNEASLRVFDEDKPLIGKKLSSELSELWIIHIH